MRYNNRIKVKIIRYMSEQHVKMELEFFFLNEKYDVRTQYVPCTVSFPSAANVSLLRFRHS